MSVYAELCTSDYQEYHVRYVVMLRINVFGTMCIVLPDFVCINPPLNCPSDYYLDNVCLYGVRNSK